MYYLDTWRCQSCPRILGRNLRLGDGSHLAAVCWGCGGVNVVTVGDPAAGERADASGATVDEKRAAVGLAPLATQSAPVAPPPKGSRGKVQEAVGSDGGFAVKGQ